MTTLNSSARIKELKKSKKLKESKKLEKCCICFDNICDTFNFPCGHAVSCLECKKNWAKTRINRGNKPNCPICRSKIKFVVPAEFLDAEKVKQMVNVYNDWEKFINNVESSSSEASSSSGETDSSGDSSRYSSSDSSRYSSSDSSSEESSFSSSSENSSLSSSSEDSSFSSSSEESSFSSSEDSSFSSSSEDSSDSSFYDYRHLRGHYRTGVASEPKNPQKKKKGFRNKIRGLFNK